MKACDKHPNIGRYKNGVCKWCHQEKMEIWYQKNKANIKPKVRKNPIKEEIIDSYDNPFEQV